jgi:group II intron reverse transcriptase/maturase
VDNAKPFSIAKREVWEAYKRVRANQGAAGVDEQSITEFEEDLVNNLSQLWNRMASGRCFPAPMRRVEIPKDNGGVGALGIPTVSDRIAQMVVKRYLEPLVEKIFHPDSYGYRPGKSAIEAVGVARQRCWRYDWALHLDVIGCFDNIDQTLLMRAVRKHTDCPWVLLYIERWLAAPVQLPDGSLLQPEKGVPQGAGMSPVLSNLFLPYAFDVGMTRFQADVRFERYADDMLCHCTNRGQAERLKGAVTQRLADWGLEVHPQKTRLVYRKDSQRRGTYREYQFDFLGFRCRPRKSKDRFGRYFTNFTPAVSPQAAKAMRQTMRRWALAPRSDKALDDLARMFNPVLRGWLNYYGHYYRSALHPTFRCLDDSLTRWAKQKYKRLRGHHRRARHWLQRVARRQPELFAHWQFFQSMAGQ